MNLASKLSEGQKIYIPKLGEAKDTKTQVLGEADEVGLININTASEAQLDTLSGVGPVTAQKIIKARPYTNINQLIDKKVVSQSVFTKIKDSITAN
jgi:competence protein ComEA